MCIGSTSALVLITARYWIFKCPYRDTYRIPRSLWSKWRSECKFSLINQQAQQTSIAKHIWGWNVILFQVKGSFDQQHATQQHHAIATLRSAMMMETSSFGCSSIRTQKNPHPPSSLHLSVTDSLDFSNEMSSEILRKWGQIHWISEILSKWGQIHWISEILRKWGQIHWISEILRKCANRDRFTGTHQLSLYFSASQIVSGWKWYHSTRLIVIVCSKITVAL